ncbi:MAG: cofactor-independent phosphoglycerate mutase [Candidatus Omnitrophica bacterium]|nr:cofactor-independent phosphoglycerate mutase [Candidatus Omnitrophota bacterium]
MKYVVVLPDGVSDVPLKELGGKTPLEAAKHPNMDWIAREGITGWARTIPPGFAPGSDVGCMSVFGYDPRRYHTGRAPLEAAAQGIVLTDSQVAFRCNTLTVEHGVMIDHSADHIKTEDSAQLMKTVSERLGGNGVQFHAGVSYRHLAIVSSDECRVTSEELAKIECTPPHDILGKPIDGYLPKGPGSDVLRRVMQESVAILEAHPVNRRRAAGGQHAATMLWFWGQGTATALPAFQQVYGKRGACISAVDIVRGIGRLAGLEILQVPGITGYFDTNYTGKAAYALKALDDGFDFVLVHVESTDEAGHMGDAKKKVQAIEDVDRLVAGALLEGLTRRGEPFGIMVVPDHPTDTTRRTHIPEPVPFAVYATNGAKDAVAAYTESAVKGSSLRFEEGHQLMSRFLGWGQTP